jgi:hypothetical protein
MGIKRKTAYKMGIDALEREMGRIGGDGYVDALYPGAFVYAARMGEEVERMREAIRILEREMDKIVGA